MIWIQVSQMRHLDPGQSYAVIWIRVIHIICRHLDQSQSHAVIQIQVVILNVSWSHVGIRIQVKYG